MNLKGNIIVIGDVMLDVYISGQASRLSPEAPVPIVAVESRTSTLGGAGNVALNLANLGCRTWLFGVKGDDVAGGRISEILLDNSIEDRLLTDSDLPTITKTRVLANSQQLLRFDEERKSNGSTLLTDINGVLDAAQAVILSDYAKGVLSQELISSVIAQCQLKGIPVFVDPKRADWSRYQGATVITPNINELEIGSGEKVKDNADVVRSALKMMEVHVFKTILVTMGARGMILLTRAGTIDHIPTRAQEVFDVSGAGDTVIATLAACMCSGYSIFESAKMANVAAGVVVGKLGTKPITIKELKESLINDISVQKRFDRL